MASYIESSVRQKTVLRYLSAPIGQTAVASMAHDTLECRKTPLKVSREHGHEWRYTKILIVKTELCSRYC